LVGRLSGAFPTSYMHREQKEDQVKDSKEMEQEQKALDLHIEEWADQFGWNVRPALESIILTKSNVSVVFYRYPDPEKDHFSETQLLEWLRQSPSI